MRRNIALRLQYDGTAYHGWQVQKTDVTVAETLERALTKVCGEPIKVVGCGRQQPYDSHHGNSGPEESGPEDDGD